MNMPSHYQGDFYRSLTELSKLQVVFSQSLSRDRAALGWSPSLAGYQSFLERRHFLKRIRLSTDRFHFLSGFPGGFVNVGRAILASNSISFAVQTELPEPDRFTPGWKKRARIFASIIKNRRCAVLGIGGRAVEFLSMLGIPSARVLPFGYFSEQTQNVDPHYNGPIIFVGQLVKRKGIDILIRAFSKVRKDISRQLLIVGGGPQLGELTKLVADQRLQERVQFLGSCERRLVIEHLRAASCLILPSRFDGWGVVVNEAIGVGLPVVVSDCCGSAELVDCGSCGMVYEADDVNALAEALKKMFSSSKNWNDYSEKALSFRSAISPMAGADYLISIAYYVQGGFLGTKPIAPWKKQYPAVQKVPTDEF